MSVKKIILLIKMSRFRLTSKILSRNRLKWVQNWWFKWFSTFFWIKDFSISNLNLRKTKKHTLLWLISLWLKEILKIGSSEPILAQNFGSDPKSAQMIRFRRGSFLECRSQFLRISSGFYDSNFAACQILRTLWVTFFKKQLENVQT